MGNNTSINNTYKYRYLLVREYPKKLINHWSLRCNTRTVREVDFSLYNRCQLSMFVLLHNGFIKLSINLLKEGMFIWNAWIQMCHHGFEAPLFTSWTPSNPGRIFFEFSNFKVCNKYLSYEVTCSGVLFMLYCYRTRRNTKNILDE